MQALQQNGTSMATEDRFYKAEIDRDSTQPVFSATHYSFFGEPANPSLEGALEEGLEAPPDEELGPRSEGGDDFGLYEEEDGLGGGDYLDEDLSLAALLREQLCTQDDEKQTLSRSPPTQKARGSPKFAGRSTPPRPPTPPSPTQAATVTTPPPQLQQQAAAQQSSDYLPAATGAFGSLFFVSPSPQSTSGPTTPIDRTPEHTHGSMGYPAASAPSAAGLSYGPTTVSAYPPVSAPRPNVTPPMPANAIQYSSLAPPGFGPAGTYSSLQQPTAAQNVTPSRLDIAPGGTSSKAPMSVEELEARMLSQAQASAAPPATSGAPPPPPGPPTSAPPGFYGGQMQPPPRPGPHGLQHLAQYPPQGVFPPAIPPPGAGYPGLIPQHPPPPLGGPSASNPPFPYPQHHFPPTGHFHPGLGPFPGPPGSPMAFRPGPGMQPPGPPFSPGAPPPPPGPHPQSPSPMTPPPPQFGHRPPMHTPAGGYTPQGPYAMGPGYSPMQPQQPRAPYMPGRPPMPYALPMRPGMPPYQPPNALGAVPRPPPRAMGNPDRYTPAQMGYRDAANFGKEFDHDAHQGNGRVSPLSRRPGAKMMSADELEYIMRCMYAAVHTGSPYTEDYYYQALVNKQTNGRNRDTFVPDALRDLSKEAERLDPSGRAKFVPLEGLGRVVYSNLRTPKVLLDIASVSSDDKAVTENGTTPPSRPLEQEPVLAARILIEYCMNLLLDVDDIDHIFAAASPSAPPRAAELASRRAALIAGISNSLNLPITPTIQTPDANGSASTPASDGVFLRVMALAKGRGMIARTLKAMQPPLAAIAALNSGSEPTPAVPSTTLLWAVLRNAHKLFGSSTSASDAAAEKSMMDATSRLAAAARDCISGIPCSAGDIAACLTAFVSGCQRDMAGQPPILPLAPSKALPLSTPGAQPVWLGDMLAALLQRASQEGLSGEQHPTATDDDVLGLAESSQPDSPEMTAATSQWQDAFSAFFSLIQAHLGTLRGIFSSMVASGKTEGVAVIKALSCKSVVQGLMGHAGNEQRTELKSAMSVFV